MNLTTFFPLIFQQTLSVPHNNRDSLGGTTSCDTRTTNKPIKRHCNLLQFPVLLKIKMTDCKSVTTNLFCVFQFLHLYYYQCTLVVLIIIGHCRESYCAF